MKKTIRKNWFKISVIILIGIIFVYLLLFISRQDKKENLSNNIECQQEGLKMHEKDILKGYKYQVPEFIFSKELETCLYKNVSISQGAEGERNWSPFIKDVYKNKILVAYTHDENNTNITAPSFYEAYNNFEKKYFK